MAASDVSDGPVLSLINKRLRALRKKQNRITQLEEAAAQGKPVLKEQEDILRSKPSVAAAIEELEKLRQPLSAAVAEEIGLAVQHSQVSASPALTAAESDVTDEDSKEPQKAASDSGSETTEDLLNLLYFASMFDVRSQSDFASTMLVRTHERGCCLTYDYVTDDEADDLLGERDLDSISALGGLLISRPVDSSLSHKNALQRCIERARLWLANSDQPIDSDSNITYSGLRAKLHKIMASDYFTTTPEMKAPVEVAAAAAGNYSPFQVPVEVEGSDSGVEYQQKENDTANFEGKETYDNQSSPVEEFHKGEIEVENHAEISDETEQVNSQAETWQNERDFESNEQQYVPRRTYQNHRGGRGGVGGGRRGYSNGRGGRNGGSRGGGGSYQNGRSQYYDQPGNYYQRNYYNNPRGRGSRGNGGSSYNNHASGVQASDVPANS